MFSPYFEDYVYTGHTYGYKDIFFRNSQQNYIIMNLYPRSGFSGSILFGTHYPIGILSNVLQLHLPHLVKFIKDVSNN